MSKPTVRQLARKMGVPVPELLEKMKAMGSEARGPDDPVDVNPLSAGARGFFWPILALVVILLWIAFGLWLRGCCA